MSAGVHNAGGVAFPRHIHLLLYWECIDIRAEGDALSGSVFDAAYDILRINNVIGNAQFLQLRTNYGACIFFFSGKLRVLMEFSAQ